MKTFRFALLCACALLASACAKVMEEAPEVTADEPEVTAPVHKITAVIDNDDITKTAYSEETNFGWVAGDRISLIALKDGVSASGYHFGYSADNDGPSSSFSALGTPDWTTYEPSGIAVYPQLAHGWFAANSYHTVTLPDTYTVTGDNFMSIIPLIGIQDELNEDLYHFKTAVGVLKLRLSNVPVSARKLVLTAPDTGDYGANNLSGTFLLPTPANGIEMQWMNSVSHTVTVEFPQQTAGSTITVYIPVPVGTISAGATFSVQDSYGTPIMTTPETLRDIPVERNVLLDLTPNNPISVEEWVSLGTGKYMDDNAFYGMYLDDRNAEDYVDVTIEQHKTQANRFRIRTPYANCANVETYLQDAANYLYIDVREDLGTGIVVNHSYKYNGGSSILFDAPYWGYDSFYYNSRILDFDDTSGLPSNIQLAPYYIDFYPQNAAQNPKVEIVFPGATPMLDNSFNYANNATVSCEDGVVSATVGKDVASVRVIAAPSIYEGVELLLSGIFDLEFGENGLKALDMLPNGIYYLVYMVENEKGAYTFKDAGTVAILDEIPLDASMVWANVDAGDKDGNLYDGYGVASLVDNDITTFWHTPYYSASDIEYWQNNGGYFSNITGTPYDYSDLDPTYGAYIDIDLGGSQIVLDFQVQACLRSGSSDFPKHVIIYASEDAQTWYQVAEVANVCSGIAAGAWINPINCFNSSPARYIRFSIISNTGDKDLRDPSACGCTHLAEIKILG